MQDKITRVVIVGGGTAGWLTAGIIAAKNPLKGEHSRTEIVLVESPEVKNLGVGEGTWPTMRDTLRLLGIAEKQFLTCCDASFKQASKFVGWQQGGSDYYYHPFTAPAGYGAVSLADAWHEQGCPGDFESWVCAQGSACERDLAPKMPQLPEYAYNFNYGYHLSADKFVALLHSHCTEQLGVIYKSAHVAGVSSHPNGDIAAIELTEGESLSGDLFIDCSGFSARLIGQHYQVPFVSKRHVLFNDTAVAAQVSHVDEQTPIASCTVATAKPHGWIWDIALQPRRGIGHVFASELTTETQAADALLAYISADKSLNQGGHTPRTIRFDPGHRQSFWINNCVAVGVSAGFVEPLEATALVLIEKSAEWIAEQLPRTPAAMQVLAKRYNTMTCERWTEIIDFIKLHYVLSSRRDTPYWQAHADPSTWPETLKDALLLWQSQPPGLLETNLRQELFSSASKQYVLYGMGFRSASWQGGGVTSLRQPIIERIRREFIHNGDKLLSQLPTNRHYLSRLTAASA
ncbi:tryptophan halogenase family protein [Alteromonas lipolytica]|uniref:Tryptophan halogenase n=1 Tax=Alteromonas lipolytica TaxID=1856405 RepID=A0A1E8FIR7_9ALTE|nr:tryptophan halogenase family protein [Alteromonas lipolytica]OFI35829.1 tryptophan halogenase [Alteromonas lipolytica]GGF81187.1 tryptophan halogenase [Alteromonas lipolytica]